MTGKRNATASAVGNRGPDRPSARSLQFVLLALEAVSRPAKAILHFNSAESS